ncbi:E3 ubiquitin-protein ligase HERC [Acrasis kona]|uniref:E3 ubiquitin-protein ligase HERC n=1 Tax=Acrasis kona TaxID=1008807 RepID=A0AAW2YVA2_9EUKA
MGNSNSSKRESVRIRSNVRSSISIKKTTSPFDSVLEDESEVPYYLKHLQLEQDDGAPQGRKSMIVRTRSPQKRASRFIKQIILSKSELLQEMVRTMQTVYRSNTARKLFLSAKLLSSVIHAVYRSNATRIKHQLEMKRLFYFQVISKAAIQRVRYKRDKERLLALQSIIRAQNIRKDYNQRRSRIAVIQNCIKTRIIAKHFKYQVKSATLLQSLIRGRLSRKYIRNMILLQSAVRGHLAFRTALKMLNSIERTQALIRGLCVSVSYSSIRTRAIVKIKRKQNKKFSDISIVVPTCAANRGVDHNLFSLLRKRINRPRRKKILFCGDNTYSQFGHSSNNADPIQCNSSLSLALDKWKIIKISTRANDGIVYGWGTNGYGELGFDHANIVKQPRKIHFDRVVRDVSVVDRKVYLGFNCSFVHLSEFDSKDIDKVYAGYSHYCLLSKQGSVYISAVARVENDFAFLSTRESRKTARLSRMAKKRDKTVNLQVLGFNSPIVQIAIGNNHVVALDEQGRVWTWGDKRLGRLGHDDGNVYAWGSNSKGQQGDSTFTNNDEPRRICEIENVSYISAGDTHCLAVCENGRCYSWGNNETQQLGILNEWGDNFEERSPKVIEMIQNIPIIAAGAGSTHSYFVAYKD